MQIRGPLLVWCIPGRADVRDGAGYSQCRGLALLQDHHPHAEQREHLLTFTEYVAVVPGWYLCFLNVTQSPPSSTPAHCIPAIGYFTSGGVAQASTSARPWPASARGRGDRPVLPPAGDYVQPQYTQQDGGATYSTAVGTPAQESSFGCVWVSE